MNARHSLTILSLLAASVAFGAGANLLPNGSFEAGKAAPQGWKLEGGKRGWETTGRTGKRSISVSGTGNDSSYWRCATPALKLGRTYRMSFYVKRLAGGGSGCVISGPSFCNRDYRASDKWELRSSVFTPPSNFASGYIRLGQWHRADTIAFDDASITEVAPVHQVDGQLVLGAGESVQGKSYQFKPAFGYEGSNYSRCLVSATAGFNSSRWVFSPGAEVIYKHQVGAAIQHAAHVKVNIGYHSAGTCLVEASRDGKQWLPVGQLDALGEKTFDLPKDLFPAQVVFVRLRSPGKAEARKDSAPGSFQVHGYAYTAALATEHRDLDGATHFLDVTKSTDDLGVDVVSLGNLLPGDGNAVRLAVRNNTDNAMEVTTSVELDEAAPIAKPKRLTLKPQEERRVSLAYTLREAGDFGLRVRVQAGEQTLYEAKTNFTVPCLYDATFGHWLGDNIDAQWWWCEGTYKVSRERPAPPSATAKPVAMAAAAGEYEPVQIVFKPKRDVKQLKASITGDARWAGAAKLYWVAYHYVHRPTDKSACVGWWPDALPPANEPVAIKANQNQPLWVLVKVPDDCPAGDHELKLTLQADDDQPIAAPIKLHVFDFAIPKTSHLESGFGLSAGRIRRYHNLQTADEQRHVWDLYMQSFREHRIAPYDFAPFDPIRTKFIGATWVGGKIVASDAADGGHCLQIVDDNPKANVTASADYAIPIDKRAAYVLSFRAKTAKPGQQYLITFNTYDANGRWISGHNIDMLFKGTGRWQRVERLVEPAKRSPKAATMRLQLRATRWRESGEDTGTAWFDDVSLVRKGGTANLIKNGDFEMDAANIEAKVDFSAWDEQAAKYLDGYGFTAFRLPLRGMGGGTFYARRAGRIGPFEQGSSGYRRVFKDYCQQLQHHLAARGWLDKAYIYWFDEPAPRDYDFVRAGMEEIKLAGPKLRRFLTEEPVEPLFGAVDIWCPVLHNYDPESCQARQKAGETIWWYVCCGPKAPYPGLFIDHNAIELRMWLWMTWKWKVQGILVWATNYWTSPCAYPSPKIQNPWDDPMGYVAGYGRPAGYIGYWGNGDGRFFYPPNRDVVNDKRKHLEGPVSSIRLEMLREGLEDYEYFWLLRDVVAKAKAAGVDAKVVAEAEGLLAIPETLIVDKTHFSRDPQPLYAHRRAVAAAIERLTHGLAK